MCEGCTLDVWRGGPSTMHVSGGVPNGPRSTSTSDYVRYPPTLLTNTLTLLKSPLISRAIIVPVVGGPRGRSSCNVPLRLPL